MTIVQTVSPKQKKEFVSLLSKGKSITYIAEEYDLNYTKLWQLLTKELKEIKARRRESIVKKAIELYKKGNTISEIAAQFNTIPTMGQYLSAKLNGFITNDIKDQHRTSLFRKRKRVKKELFLSKITGCASDDEAAKKLGVPHRDIKFKRQQFGIPQLSTFFKKAKAEKRPPVTGKTPLSIKKASPFPKSKV